MADRARSSQVDSVVQALHARFGTAVELAAIAAQVEAEFAAYRDVPITDFVPILVTRRVRTKLRSSLPV